MKKFEILLRNILLKLILFFNPVNKDFDKPVFSDKSKLLFIRLNRIGDALVTTPLLYEIKQQIGCKIYVLADKKNHFIFRNNPSIDEVIIFNKDLNSIININKIIKKNNIDAVIDLHDDVSTTVSFLIALAKVRYKFALKKSNSSLYTNLVDRLDSHSNHVIDRILQLADLFNLTINKKNISVKYFPSKSETENSNSAIKSMNTDNKYLVGINISAGSEARFWGVDNYKKLIESLSKYDIKIIVFSSMRDEYLANQIADKNDLYPLTNSFDNFASAILNLNFLITPDTSVVHIASIKNIPVFGLYVKYKTNDMIWNPYNTDFDCVLTEEPALTNITFEEVKNKLIPFLEKHLDVQ
jgi:ADP-heptose:LPS heptosyltransferase